MATLVLFMVAQHPGVLTSAVTAKATVSVKHSPLKYFIAGRRIQVEAKVTDPQGVSLVRCYFRAAGQSDYAFLGMKTGGKDIFTGILPSPAAETKGIEYLFLIVNGKNHVVKTQVFKTEIKDTKEIPAWQIAGEGTITVSTELPQATEPAGFNDSITTDVVESSARFGIVAGISSTVQVAAGAAGSGTAAVGVATGAAAEATSAGTVTASTGFSTTASLGASAAMVAVFAGTAVLSGGSGGGGGGDCTGQTLFAILDRNHPDKDIACAQMNRVCAGLTCNFFFGVGRWATRAEKEAAFAGQHGQIVLDGTSLPVWWEGTHPDKIRGDWWADTLHADWTATRGTHTVSAFFSGNGQRGTCTFTVAE